jgi:membrane-associated phospholipid phosphatase/predicted MFS family arabinose efflux permease
VSAHAAALPRRRHRSAGRLYLIAFSAAALGAGLGRAVTTTYLPVLLDQVRDAPGLIGTVMLVNAAAGFGVPLVVGIWSDRLGTRRRGRRLPFIAGGSVVTAGGLAAVALGSGSSYLVLTLAGAVAYVGLNAVTTAHRALVPECFDETGRPRATSAQELAMLVGGLVGVAVGGSLTEAAPWAPFALAAALVPLLAAPTLARVREPRASFSPSRRERHALRYYARASSRPGVRAFLAAQVLWVLGYAAMPVFFILYAERVIGLDAAIASLWLAGFGIATGAAMLAAGRVRDPARQGPLLALGVASMGVGFLTIPAAPVQVVAMAGMLSAAVGYGLISTLGFPLFTRLIPAGEAGGYTALYFSARAISSTIALPTAGWTIAVTDSYRSLFVIGGAATLAALVPLARVPGASRPPLSLSRPRLPELSRPRGVGALAWTYAGVLVLALLLSRSSLQKVDERLFTAVNSLAPVPEVLWHTLNPHTRNYLVLGLIAVMAAILTRRQPPLAVAGLALGANVLAWGLLESIYALWDRARPEEVLDTATIALHGTWAHIESFPSGHMALTTALAAGAWLAFPRLRLPLVLYVALVAATRIVFGAHFPLDTLAGVALGYTSARAVFALMVAAGLLRDPRRADAEPCVDCGERAPATA